MMNKKKNSKHLSSEETQSLLGTESPIDVSPIYWNPVETQLMLIKINERLKKNREEGKKT